MNDRSIPAWFLLILAVMLTLSGCNVTLQIKDGETAYALKKYALAVDLLKEDYDKAKDKKDKHRLSLMIAKSYLAFSQPDKAEFWYKRAVDTEVEPNDMLGYALVLKQNGKFTEAIEILNLFYQYDRSQRLVVEGHVNACEEILEAMGSETYTVMSNLSSLNTQYSEFAPVLHDGMMTYASNAPSASDNGDEVDQWTGRGFADIRSAIEISREEWQIDDAWEPTYNTRFHEAVLAMHPDGNELYFTRCGREDDNQDVCKIYRSFKEFDEWTEPEQVFLFEDSVNVGHPFLSPDGKLLYFSSDAEFGYGGKDLYVSTRIGEEWEPPINLGPRVNTPDDEMFPHITADGKLVFASSGHYGYGGLDLFQAEKRGRIFTGVRHFPYPINTGADDFAAYLTTSDDDSVEITGYMTSNREGGAGSDDIYFFEKRLAPEIKLPPPVFVLKGTVSEKVFEDFDNPNSEIIGQQPLPGVAVSLSDDTDPNLPYLVGQFTTDEEGRFETILDRDVIYLLMFNKTGYFALKDQLRTTGIEAEDGDTVIITREVVMERIVKEVEFTINNIYYDLDSANIRPDAALVLDSLANILLDNPTLRVELGSHTDSRGSDPYNLDLSQRRAESAVAYLISNGIDSERLTARGYGETRLVNECDDDIPCTEEKHQENRRTTFKILGLDFELRSDE
jgi:outer membrane protein OmpA-like peptidoglycan-associated protein/tetratricopeptide (TPR) repeat protein